MLILYFCRKKGIFMVNKKSGGKRIGKSKPDKANNQLNRRVK